MGMNITAAKEHNPTIERSIGTVKDRVQCGFRSVPFKKMPNQMIMELVCWAVFWLNSHMLKDGVSQMQSPPELLTGVMPDANEHAKFKFGECMHAHSDKMNNTMQERALEGVHLCPSGNRQGGFWAFNTNTGKQSHCNCATPAPMTETVIAQVERIATSQNATKGIMFGD